MKLKWKELNEGQKTYLCCNIAFDPKPFWNKLSMIQKDKACQNSNFKPDTLIWMSLSQEQKLWVCKHSRGLNVI